MSDLRELSEDLDLLRRTSERFIEATCSIETVRKMADAGAAVDAGYHRQAAELGWFSFLVPESLGGGSISGEGLRDAAVVADLRGRSLQPGPFVSTNVVADAIATSGSQQQQSSVLPALLGGETSALWAAADATGDWTAGAGVTALETSAGYALTGAKGMCHDHGAAGWVLVTARNDAGPVQFLLETSTPGIRLVPLDGLDLTRRWCRVEFNGVEASESALVGSTEAAGRQYDRQLNIGIALTLAEAVGAMDRIFTTTVEYAKDRTAFGRPIGSFQALKHLMADTSLVLECSKAATDAAIQAIGASLSSSGTDDRDATEVASMAKAYVSEAAITVTQSCWQLFGGIAYTWEHDFHYFLRRVTADASLFGDAAWHRERICQLHGLGA